MVYDGAFGYVKINEGGVQLILRKLMTSGSLLFLALLLLGARGNIEIVTAFEDVQKTPLAAEKVEEDIRIDLFQSEEKGVVSVKCKSPLYQAQGQYLIAYDDFVKISGKEALSYSKEAEMLSLNQINRVRMALDKPVYVKQSVRLDTEVYPIMREGELYVPLRFLLEELGYIVNFSEDRGVITVAKPEENNKLVPLRQIQVDSIAPYRDGNMATNVLDIIGSDLIAWGEKVPGGLASYFHINEESQIFYRRRLSLEAPIDYDDENKTTVTVDKYYAYLERIDKGYLKKIVLPKSLQGERDVRIDGSVLYFNTKDGVFSFDTVTKNLHRIIQEPVEDFDVVEGRVLFKRQGRLYLYRKQGGWLLPDGGEDFILGSHAVVVDDKEAGIIRVYDLLKRKCIRSIVYRQSSNHEMVLIGGRYLSIGQNNSVRLVDLESDTSIVLDMINIEPTLRNRHVSWFWSGHLLKGYVHSDGVKIAQCVSIRP